MTEQVDVQELVIGVGTVLAFVLYGYGTFLRETILGVAATDLAVGAFAGTFLVVAVLHGAYGRRDFAVAHAAAGAGLVFVAAASSGPEVLVGILLLVAGGSYVAVATMRARRDRRAVQG
ncbi:hypothetical protein EA462_03765 [Natrarchaeobius halalkaliphilus]|uniref:Uncharacterized protein n=1 Tax=Natrarchaeobius halalkaliphilus TaxID=1679091 RepID=A0A3N6LNZ2_9EURY|nr:hypothetical protein [Natrarchaeobius halalkaliphilus]RQG91123.1 hypothetical protein EA462_03765 [Natrarchaeobius halalkaliphilus]